MSQTTLRRNESGLAAITVTLIILGIVTLIIVGFATLMRREQRQALDQQLSTQAFYAAESGVNVARDYIDGNLATLSDVDSCEDTPQVGIMDQASLGNNVSFTCVLMDVTPTGLQTRIDPDGASWVMKVETANGQPVRNLEINWQVPDQRPTDARFADPTWSPTHLLTPENRWGDTTGVVRLMLIPDVPSRNQQITDTYQAFLYPNAGNGTTSQPVPAVTPTPGQQGLFVNGNCNVSREPFCKVRLTGLTRSSYYIRLKAIYSPSSILVQSFADDGQVQELKNGQAKIDVTGKAADVVRRVQVNVPLTNAGAVFPEYALQTFTTLCKRFYTLPGESVNDVNSANEPNITLTPAQSAAQQAACNP